MPNKHLHYKIFLKALLLVYIIIVFGLTLNQQIALCIMKISIEWGLIEKVIPPSQSPLTLVPFVAGEGTIKHFFYNIIGNFFLFVPLGSLVFLSLPACRRKALFAFLLCFIFSLLIEIVQYFLVYRQTDVNDLIWNSAGALTGIFAIAYIQKHIEVNVHI